MNQKAEKNSIRGGGGQALDGAASIAAAAAE